MAYYRKRGNGWEVRVSYKAADGKLKQWSRAGFQNKRDAKIAAANAELFLKDGLDKSKAVFIDYFMNWFEIYKKPVVRERSQIIYMNTYNVIKTYYGKSKMDEITPESSQKFINAFAQGQPPFKKPHAKETVKRMLVQYRSALKQATKEGVYKYNPAEDVIIGKTAPANPESSKYLTEKDQIKLKKYLYHNRNYNSATYFLILTGLDTGMRPGELFGLFWEDIDLDNKIIHVKQTWTYGVEKPHFGPVKNDRPRDVAINDTLADILIDFKKNRKVISKLAFPNKFGEPLSSSYLSRILKEAQIAAGTENIIHPHGMRHSHASLMLYHGMNIKALAKRLGHSNITTTLNVYAHVLEELEEKDNRLMNDVLNDDYKKII